MQEKTSRATESSLLQERLQLVKDWGAIGMWEIDLLTRKVIWATHSEQMLGLSPVQHLVSLEQLISFVHPEDRNRVEQQLSRALQERWHKDQNNFRIIRADGQVRHLTVFVHFLFNGDGTPSRMLGLAQDITELAEHHLERIEIEERLRIIHAASKAWTWQIDLADGTVIRPFQSPESHIPKFPPGQTLDEWMGRVHPEDRARVRAGLTRVIESGEPWEDELRLQWPDGSYRWIHDRAKRIDRPGRSSLLAGAALDITERKHVEQHLVENEERLRSAYIAGKMWPWELEVPSMILRRSLDSTNYKGPLHPAKQDLGGFLQTVHPEDRERVRESIENAVRLHVPYSVDYRILWNDGNYHWISSRGGMVQNDQGVWKLMGVALDLEEQRRTAEALEESERLRLLAVDAANMGIWSQDMRTGEVQWSDRQCELFGIADPRSVQHRDDFRKLVFPEDLKLLDAEGAALAASHAQRFRFEFRITRPSDGAVRWIVAVGEFAYDDDGLPLRMVGVNYDVTELKHRENILRENEAFRRLAMVAANMGAWEWDFETRRLRWSEEEERLFGFEPGTFDGRLETFLSRVHPADLSVLHEYERKLLRSGELRYETEFRIILPDGVERWIGALGEIEHDEHGRATRIYGVNFDVTARKQTEQALRTGEKLATAGRMAASLAHEINNPLAAVTNLLYLIGQDSGLSEGAKRFVSMASSEVSRVSHITRNTLAFYRETSSPIEIDLSDLVQSVLELYAPKIREFHIKEEFESGDRCRVVAFPGELRQVVSNLVVNAIEAMAKGGTLRIRVQARRDWRRNRSGVRLVVADTGVGIPREAQARLFEPFFTTKGEKGTGLGLWVSRDIISKHEGSIRVRSSQEPGRRGTCFSLFLPAENSVAERRTNAEANSSAATT